MIQIRNPEKQLTELHFPSHKKMNWVIRQMKHYDFHK